MQIIDDSKREADLADAIVARTHEVYAYDLNIANYQTLLTTLPSEWPEHLVEYRQTDPHAAAVMCPNEHVEELALLQQYDRVNALLSTEILERTKAATLLEVLDAQLTGPGRDAAIQAAVDRRNAALAQQVS